MEGAALRELLRGDGASVTASEQALASDQVVSSDAPEPTTNSFPETTTSLSLLMVVSDDVLWVEQLEDQLLRQEQLRLIAAMARAIRGVEVRCTHQRFDWPPAGQVSPTGTQHNLREMPQVTRTDSPPTTPSATSFIWPCAVLPESEMPVTQSPSSLDLLRDAAKKPIAWKAIKPCVGDEIRPHTMRTNDATDASALESLQSRLSRPVFFNDFQRNPPATPIKRRYGLAPCGASASKVSLKY